MILTVGGGGIENAHDIINAPRRAALGVSGVVSMGIMNLSLPTVHTKLIQVHEDMARGTLLNSLHLQAGSLDSLRPGFSN